LKERKGPYYYKVRRNGILKSSFIGERGGEENATVKEVLSLHPGEKKKRGEPV